MKVWHLEQEWDAFLEGVIGGREQKKGRRSRGSAGHQESRCWKAETMRSSVRQAL